MFFGQTGRQARRMTGAKAGRHTNTHAQSFVASERLFFGRSICPLNVPYGMKM